MSGMEFDHPDDAPEPLSLLERQRAAWDRAVAVSRGEVHSFPKQTGALAADVALFILMGGDQ